MPTESQLTEALIRHISGFKPETTGGLCDVCLSVAFQEGDHVHVFARFTGARWELYRTTCTDDDVGLPESGTEAIVECELGPSPRGEFFPLYNPDVVAIQVADEHLDEVATDGGPRCPACGDPHSGDSVLCDGCSPFTAP